DRCKGAAQHVEAFMRYCRWGEIRPPEFDCREDKAQDLALRVASVVEDRWYIGPIRQRRLLGTQQQANFSVAQQRSLRGLQRVVAMADAFDLSPLQRDDRVGDP